MINKAVINASRLKWCLESLELPQNIFAEKLKISIKTIEAVWQNEPSLTIKQLQRVAKFFNRSMLFFINPNEIKEEKILSPQFRTINNRKPIHSRKIRFFIEQVEKHRKIYLSLLEDLEDEFVSEWYPNNLSLIKKNNIERSVVIRDWLDLNDKLEFKDLREKIEEKGIMVFVSNSFNGSWQIAKNELVRGFSLYYDVLPIIVIKKQSEGAQAFTLFHELVHLLLHKNSVLDYEDDYHSDSGIEKEANRIAGNILIPDNFIENINIKELINLEVNQIDKYLDNFSKNWCVSNEAILVRLLHKNLINKSLYISYQNFRDYLFRKKKEEPKNGFPRSYRHREPLNIFGKQYVYTVLEAYHSQHITLAKTSTYLDNIKIEDVHKLVDYVI